MAKMKRPSLQLQEPQPSEQHPESMMLGGNDIRTLHTTATSSTRPPTVMSVTAVNDSSMSQHADSPLLLRFSGIAGSTSNSDCGQRGISNEVLNNGNGVVNDDGSDTDHGWNCTEEDYREALAQQRWHQNAIDLAAKREGLPSISSIIPASLSARMLKTGMNVGALTSAASSERLTLKRLMRKSSAGTVLSIEERIARLTGAMEGGRINGDFGKRKMVQLEYLAKVARARAAQETKYDEIAAQRAMARVYDSFSERRHIAWVSMARKDAGKCQRQMSMRHTVVTKNQRTLAMLCQKRVRNKARDGRFFARDAMLRGKRLMREMLVSWRRSEREAKTATRRQQKSVASQRKAELERMEMDRQRKKLNFLITQTELFSHFVGSKMNLELNDSVPHEPVAVADSVLTAPPTAEELAALNTDESAYGQCVPDVGDLTDDQIRVRAMEQANSAVARNLEEVRRFDVEAEMRRRKASAQHQLDHGDQQESSSAEVPPRGGQTAREAIDGQSFNPSSMPDKELMTQPTILNGELKAYQLKGMNWLANLYEQGINGILADEMGLGKTIQTIAFLAHLAERHNIWGPFLVVSPVSTLHNWQQEIVRFVPKFKVLPYWGNQKDRKILRKYWSSKYLYTEQSPFHVLVTSYQLVVTDEKYFSRVKWQQMVLDEAQAIKSSQSTRWKTLLGFGCRNRLLLTGTPIQNTMAELWSLLHFIMPTLFDSHDEFSEWFSKDIESHAEKNSMLDPKQVERLRMILKPFMLRRIKRDVENELGEKVEITIECDMTARQRLLYESVRAAIPMEDLLRNSGLAQSIVRSGNDAAFTQHLMNLVMQFRKVCNHPELFELRGVTSPFQMQQPYWSPEHRVRMSSGRGVDLGRSVLLDVTVRNRSSIIYSLPRLIYHDVILAGRENRPAALVRGALAIFSPGNLHDGREKEFGFLRLMGLSSADAALIFAATAVVCARWLLARRYSAAELRTALLPPRLVRYMLRLWPHFRFSRVHQFLHRSAAGDDVDTLSPLVFSPENQITALLACIYCPRALAPPVEVDCDGDRGFATAMMESRRGDAFIISNIFRRVYREVTEEEEGYNATMEWRLPQDPIRQSPSVARWLALLHPSGALRPKYGWARISVPPMNRVVADAGKMLVLDRLLDELKAGGHRVLIFSQMTRMIDLLEDFMTFRKHRFMRLDGSSKISERRDMVADFQTRSDIFVFLLSTRAGGLGINLTAADTVIFYDSDWNPTADQQAMDRAHRVGQTKLVTVYRLITKGTVEERILQRAQQKSEIQRVVIQGGSHVAASDNASMKPREVMSLLLGDAGVTDAAAAAKAEQAKNPNLSKNLPAKRRLMSNGEDDGSSSHASDSSATVFTKRKRRNSPTSETNESTGGEL